MLHVACTLPQLETMEIDIQNLELGLGASLDSPFGQIKSRLSGIDFATRLSTLTSPVNEFFISSSCLDHRYQGTTLARETIHPLCPLVFPNNVMFLCYTWNHKPLGAWNFQWMWHGPMMVHHIFLASEHEFIHYNP